MNANDILILVEAGHKQGLTSMETVERIEELYPDADPKQIRQTVGRIFGTETETRFNLTDFGNAERLCCLHGDNLRFCHDWGKWLVWTGRCWKIDDTNEIERFAKNTVRQIYSEATVEPDEVWRQVIASHGGKSESKIRIANMIQLASSESAISAVSKDFDLAPYLLNAANCTLNLQTGEIHRQTRTDMVTKAVPVPYDTAAICPGWDNFLKVVFAGSSPLIDFVQRAVGYSLTSITSEQCLFFLFGTGANGKTTFIETLRGIFGDYFQKAPTSMIAQNGHGVADGIPNDIARLPGSRFVVVAEVEEGRRLRESLVKDLTGSDTLVARFLHGEFFEFSPTFKLWIYGNHKPVIRGTDAAIWRRIHQVPFAVTIPSQDQDPHLIEKLRGELPGILAWAVRGCQAWLEKGLNPPAEVREATSDYRSEMDILGVFLNDRCATADNARTLNVDLYSAYTDWAEKAGEYSISQRRLSLRLAERGFRKGRGTGGARYWEGLRLLDEAEGGK